jgi:hypothetical protein
VVSENPKYDYAECRAIIFQWLDLLVERSQEGDESDTGVQRFARIAEIVPDLKLAADKSNYLGRRFGGGQHRTERCPIHDGHWSGYGGLDKEPCACALGVYDITGWLPAPGDENEDLGGCVAPGCQRQAIVEMVSLIAHDGFKAGDRTRVCPDHIDWKKA